MRRRSSLYLNARAPGQGERSWSGAPRGDAKPVAVGVYEVAFPPGEPFFIDGNPELLGHGIDVLDIEVDQGVRPSCFLLTAGHCGPDHDNGNWLHAGQPLGPLVYNTWDASAQMTLDVGAIPVADDYAANWIYTRAGSNPYPVRASKPVGQDAVNDTVCISVPYADPVGGWREGSKCGFITEVEKSYHECADGAQGECCDEIAILIDQVEVQMSDDPAVKPGDSGGPVFSNSPNTARGIQGGYLFPKTDGIEGPGAADPDQTRPRRRHLLTTTMAP